MNLLPVTIIKKDGQFMFTFEGSDLQVEVPRKYDKVVHDGMKVTLGVRPVDVMIAKKKVKSTPVPVAIYENLGDERRVSVRVGDNLLSMTTAEDIYYEPGQNVQLIFHEERTHLFDIISGDRIRS